MKRIGSNDDSLESVGEEYKADERITIYVANSSYFEGRELVSHPVRMGRT